MLYIFSFVFSIFGSFIGFIFNDFVIDKDYGITFGKLLFAVFLLCFILNKLLGMARSEIEEAQEDRRFWKRQEKLSSLKEREGKMGKHSAMRARHAKD